MTRLLGLLLLALAGCNQPAAPESTARVVRVVDGDTIRVVQGGREEAVRYIGGLSRHSVA